MPAKAKPSKVASQVLAEKQSLPVQMTTLSIIDESYAAMKEKFSEEMKRVHEQMFQLGKNLTKFYNQNSAAPTSAGSNRSIIDWDAIQSSPLVEGEGNEQVLQLRFDVSQFDPEEVVVKIADDYLTVSATHDEKTENSAMHREYIQRFPLPKDTNPKSVVSCLSPDGLLTVQAPLVKPFMLTDTPVANKPAAK